jgi:hypothetical protein
MIAKNERTARSRDWPFLGAAIVTGILAGLVDFHNNEPQAAALVLLGLCGLMGFLRPAGAWRWGVVASLGIPTVYLLGRSLGCKPVSWPEPNIFASLVALVPGLIGVYAGALTRSVFRGTHQ